MVGSQSQYAPKQVPGELVGNTNSVQITIGGQPGEALLDTGSSVSTISQNFLQKNLSTYEIFKLDTILEVEGAGGHMLPYLGYIEIEVEIPSIGSGKNTYPLLVVPDTNFNKNVPILLGTNILCPVMENCKKTYGVQFLQKASLETPWQLSFKCLSTQEKKLRRSGGVVAFVKSAEVRIAIPPRTTLSIDGFISKPIPFRQCSVVVQGLNKPNLPEAIQVMPTLLNYDPSDIGMIPVTISNCSSRQVVVYPRSLIAELAPVHPFELCDTLYMNCDTNNNLNSQIQDKSAATDSKTQHSAQCISLNQNTSSGTHVEDKPSFIKSIDLSKCSVSDTELDRLKTFLTTWKDVFSLHDNDIGCTSILKHKIHLTDYNPIKQRHRRVPPAALEELREHLCQLLEAGIIRRSHSPWASNIVLVRKKNGKLRMCVDYRELNKRTIRDSYSLPRIDELLDCLGGQKYFSVLDMKSGYHQVEIEENHKAYTAFTTGPLGLYEFNRLPFGLCTSPAIYQRIMEQSLGDLNHSICLIYLDDLIVFSKTIDEHFDRLGKVFEKVREAGMKFVPEKCSFLQTSVKYVGHVVSEKGIETDPAKISKIADWPVPGNIDQLRSFLGFTGYYRRFIKDYAKLAKPLYDLLVGQPNKKKSKSHLQPPVWNWTTLQDNAFKVLKEKLCQPPILGYPDFSLPFELHTDASINGISAILYQTQNGQKKVISYASKGLTKSQSKYSAYKLEFLALKWAVTEKYHDYLYGNSCTIYTDNNPLTYVLSSAKLDATGHRWLSELASYDIKIKYRPGSSNVDADILSRLPEVVDCTNTCTEPVNNTKTLEINNSVIQAICCMFQTTGLVQSLSMSPDIIDNLDIDLDQFQVRNWRTAQCKDPIIAPFVRFVTNETKPKFCTIAHDPESKGLLKVYDQLKVVRGVLYRIINVNGEEKHQLVLPKEFRSLALKGLHDDIGHMGRDKTLNLVRERFFWPGMTSDVELKIRNCDRCLRRKSPTNERAPLVNIKTHEPLELVCVDFLTLEMSKGGFQYILVVTDHYTRYAQAFPTKNMTAKTTADVLFNQYFVHYGLPKRLHSDQGANFESKLIKELCNIANISKSHTSIYHPMGNGLCERFNRTLLNMLGTLENTQKSNWKSHVAPLVHAYNCSRNDSTGYAPFQLMFGRVPRLPIDLVLGLPSNSSSKHSTENYTQYVESLRTRLASAYELANKMADQARVNQKSNFDKKARVATINENDRVLVRTLAFEGKHKLADKYEDQVYIVVDQPNREIPVFVVKPENGQGKPKTLHRNHLLPINSLPVEPPSNDDLLIKEVDQGISSIINKETNTELHNTKTSDQKDDLFQQSELEQQTESVESDSDDESIIVTVHTDQVKSQSTSPPVNKTPEKPTTSPKSPPIPVPRRSKRLRKPSLLEQSGDYIMQHQPKITSDWIERAQYLKYLSDENVLQQMPESVYKAMLQIVTNS